MSIIFDLIRISIVIKNIIRAKQSLFILIAPFSHALLKLSRKQNCNVLRNSIPYAVKTIL